MRTKAYIIAVFLVITLALITYSQSKQNNRDVLFQVSTLNALIDGIYDGDTTFKTIKQHGDFGIGTFNALDGEMVGLDGKYYKIKSDGKADLVADTSKTPFAAVTFFDNDKITSVKNIPGYDELKQYLDTLLPTENIFYAIKIDGKFDHIKTRSVPKQSKPYPKLTEVTKDQPTFDLHDIEGTLIGFKCPEYVKGVNVPGYHFHFISKDKKKGGHLLQCKINEASVKIDNTTDFFMTLPKGDDFYEVDLDKEMSKEIHTVESMSGKK